MGSLTLRTSAIVSCSFSLTSCKPGGRCASRICFKWVDNVFCMNKSMWIFLTSPSIGKFVFPFENFQTKIQHLVTSSGIYVHSNIYPKLLKRFFCSGLMPRGVDRVPSRTFQSKLCIRLGRPAADKHRFHPWNP